MKKQKVIFGVIIVLVVASIAVQLFNVRLIKPKGYAYAGEVDQDVISEGKDGG